MEPLAMQQNVHTGGICANAYPAPLHTCALRPCALPAHTGQVPSSGCSSFSLPIASQPGIMQPLGHHSWTGLLAKDNMKSTTASGGLHKTTPLEVVVRCSPPVGVEGPGCSGEEEEEASHCPSAFLYYSTAPQYKAVSVC